MIQSQTDTVLELTRTVIQTLQRLKRESVNPEVRMDLGDAIALLHAIVEFIEEGL